MKPILPLLLWAAPLIASAQQLSVTTTEAGQLATLIDATARQTTTSLKVSGPINGADVIVLREMMTAGVTSSESHTGVLAELDLSDATIEASDDVYYKTSKVDYTTQANTVGDYMFNKCVTLTSVKLPRSATRIGQNALLRLEALTSVELPEALVTIEKSAFAYSSALAEVSFPASLDTIQSYAFQSNLGLKAIRFAEGASLRYVGESAFNYCTSLTEAPLPMSVEVIGNSAFSGDTLITAFTFPTSLREVGNNVFQSCSRLASVSELPAGVTSFGYGVFQGAPLSAITVNAANASYVVHDGVLYDAALTTLLYMPERCGKTSFTVPTSVRTIERFAFYRVSTLRDLHLNEGLTTILNTAFSTTGLETLVIPASVTSISSYMLEGCESLRGVTFLCTQLAEVPANTFRNASQLTSVAFSQAEPPTFNKNTFYGNPESIDVYVPAASIPAYQTAMAVANRSSYVFHDIATSAIPTIEGPSAPVRTERFDLSGRPVSPDAKGFVIQRRTLSDGSQQATIVNQ